MIKTIINFCLILMAGDLLIVEMEKQGMIRANPMNLILDVICFWRWKK